MSMLNKLVSVKDKMVNKADKICIGAMTAATTLAASAVPTFAAGLDVSGAQNAITSMIDSLLTPILALVGSIGTLYCVLLGVKYAKAEEPQDREKAKAHLKNAIIGFVLIFVLIVALRYMMPSFEKWMNANKPATTR